MSTQRPAEPVEEADAADAADDSTREQSSEQAGTPAHVASGPAGEEAGLAESGEPGAGPDQTQPTAVDAGGETQGGGAEADPGEQDDPLDQPQISVDRSRVRKAPRFGRFLTIGVMLGLLTALLQTLSAEPDAIAEAGGPWAGDAWGFFWLMSAIFVPLGIGVMTVLALVLDRVMRQRRGR